MLVHCENDLDHQEKKKKKAGDIMLPWRRVIWTEKDQVLLHDTNKEFPILLKRFSTGNREERARICDIFIPYLTVTVVSPSVNGIPLSEAHMGSRRTHKGEGEGTLSGLVTVQGAPCTVGLV